MNEDLPSQAQIVIMGGGVIGTALAYQLSQLGHVDVVVLERGQLGCGTSWHAAGNIPMMDKSADIVRMNRDGASLYESFDAEQSIGWRRCGRVMFARTDERLAEYERLIETAAQVGVEAFLLSPAEAQQKMPIFRTDDLVGALWSPRDGRVNPTDLIATYARKARESGVKIVEGTKVEAVLVEHDKVTGVRTSGATIRCEYAVNCAGLWARTLGLANDVNIPIYSVEHFYALTDVVEGVTPDMPSFRDPDGLIYGREEVGGLLVGCFDRNAKTISPDSLPDDFFFSLLNEDWEQFGPYMEQGVHRIPALADVGVRTLLNGPEGFTPDSSPILDAAPDIQGYFVLAGLSSAGILRSAGMAQALANWLVDGDPGMPVAEFSLSRFSAAQNDEAWLQERIRHVPSGHLST